MISPLQCEIATLPFSQFKIEKSDSLLNADIVHLHWINAGMIKIEDLAKIRAPIVWSLHDMWAFTGGCHYDEECQGYEKECGNCKVLGSDKESYEKIRVNAKFETIMKNLEMFTEEDSDND